jgi:hypothetical protein
MPLHLPRHTLLHDIGTDHPEATSFEHLAAMTPCRARTAPPPSFMAMTSRLEPSSPSMPPAAAPRRRPPFITDEPLEGMATLPHPLGPSNAADDLATLSIAAGETTTAQDLALFTPFTYLVTIVLRPAFVPPFSTTAGRVQPYCAIVGPC